MRTDAGITYNGSVTPVQDFIAGTGTALGQIYYTSTTKLGAILGTTTVTVDPTGSLTPQAHSNTQPVIAANYIIYIP
jgi:microcystin-dependent protein